MFGLKRKPKTNLPKEDILVKMELSNEFAKSEQVQEIIDNLSENQASAGLVPLKESLPFASFKTAEDFLQALRTQVASKENDSVSFAYFGVWQYDTDKPVSEKKKKENPIELIEVPFFEVAYDFENLTKPLFEDIFNNPENDGVEYSEKKELCEMLKQAYIDSTSEREDMVARIPSLEEVKTGNVDLSIVKNVPGQSQNSSQEANNPIYDPSVNDFVARKELLPSEPSKTEDISKANSDNPEITNSTLQMDLASSEEEKIQKKDDENALKAQQEIARNNEQRQPKRKQAKEEKIEAEYDFTEEASIAAPQFTVDDLEAVPVSDDNYVSYKLNERKKHNNNVLKLAAKRISDANKRILLEKQVESDRQINERLEQFELENSDVLDNLHEEISKKHQTNVDREINKVVKNLDKTFSLKKQEAKAVYENKLKLLDEERKEAEDQKRNEIVDRENKAAEVEYDKRFAEELETLNNSVDKYREELTRKAQIDFQDAVSALAISANEKLNDLVQKCEEDHEQYKQKVLRDNLRAQEVVASKNRAIAEKTKLAQPFEQLKQAEDRIHKLLNDNQTQTSAVESLRQQNEALQTELKNMNMRYEQLMNNKVVSAKEEAAQALNSQANNANNAFNQYLQYQMAQDINKSNNASNRPSEAPKLKRTKKGFLFGSIASILILGILGAGGYTFYQMDSNSKQVQAQTDKKISAMQSSFSESLSREKKKHTSQPKKVSLDDENKQAVNALHANDLTELDKHSAESYYDLDKALIKNDPQEVITAVNKLNNLDLHDHYRAVQTMYLLKKANNNLLATKVAQANGIN